MTDSIRHIRNELENGNITFIAVPAAFVGVILAWSFFLKRHKHKNTTLRNEQFAIVIKEYNRLCKRLDIPEIGNETLMHHFQRHSDLIDSATRDSIQKFLEAYENCRYGMEILEPELVAALRALRQRTRKR